MANAPLLKINPTKTSDIEFDVTLQGMDGKNKPVVRFVLIDDTQEIGYSFCCKKMSGGKNKWSAKIPTLDFIKETALKFHVEVIVEGRYFEPAQGEVTLVADSPGSKPTAMTSFTVRQDDERKDEEDEEITGQYAPTNGLLKPEFPPPESHVKTAQAEKDDQAIDMDKLASHVTPGETTDPEPQKGNNVADEGDEEEFDPRRVAEDIMRNVFGTGLTRPEKPGSLFGRRADGSPIVEGLDTPAEKIAKAAKAAKVREILKGK